MSPPILLGMGNPLLDISAKVDPSLLEKYNLKANDAILYEKEDIFDEFKSLSGVEYIPGGSTQNSIRVAQWILGQECQTAFFGCVGSDKASKILSDKLKESKVDARYQVDSARPTGRCAVLVTGTNRSLVTKLDAANHYTTAHLAEESNAALMNDARIFYSAGFFLTVCVDAMIEAGTRASASKEKIFSMNLSAPFLSTLYRAPQTQVMLHTDIVFGNHDEAFAFVKESLSPVNTDTISIAKSIAMYPKVNESKPRMVVITRGADSVVVVENGKVKEFEVTRLSEDQIVDTNGAGDAFVGGFLAQLAIGAKTETCVKCGIWAATQIIQRSGCTFPAEMTFKP